MRKTQGVNINYTDFNEIRMAFLNAKDPECAKSLALKLVEGYQSYSFFTYNRRPFYRGRIVQSKQLYKNDFSYNRNKDKVLRGRCNKEKNPVFYASTGKEVVLLELKDLKIGSKLIIGEWINLAAFYTFAVGYNKAAFKKLNALYEAPDLEIKSGVPPSAHQLKINKRIEALFSHIFTERGDKFYTQTISLSELYFKYFRRFSAAEHGVNVYPYPAIMYPSVENRANGHNLAFSTEFADKYLKLISCAYIEITDIQDNYFGVNLLDLATEFDGEEIKWSGKSAMNLRYDTNIIHKLREGNG